MSYFRLLFVALNGILFLGLATLSIRYRGRETSTRTQRLWLVVAIVSGALVIGSIQRLLVQASLLGWLPESLSRSATTDWQLAQSAVVAILAIAAFREIRKLAASFATTERVAGSIVDRVRHVEVDSLELSPRETEVLEHIGSGLLSDAELGEVLHISSSTIQTHVKSLLRKTGLNTRKDLIAVAYLLENSR